MNTKEKLLKDYNISEQFFEDAGISWGELTEIYYDFSEKKEKYARILKSFEEEHLQDPGKMRIHSYRTRIKDPEHLIIKIIRKRKENYKKYKKLTKDNYEMFLTDLIGIRCFVLFKEQWEYFHSYITNEFKNDAQFYVSDSIKDYDPDESHNYIAEAPKAHIRNGDSRKIYENILQPECILSDKIYRSVHYIIKYKGVYLEIQVRTLFEEGWGEVEHSLIYPYYQEDAMLNEYSELLNRLAGLADEMGSFFGRLRQIRIQDCGNEIIQKQTEEKDSKHCSEVQPELPEDSGESEKVKGRSDTPESCLNEVMKE